MNHIENNKQYEWNSIQELFQGINEKCRYLILRNHEDIELGLLTIEGHDDIDILCGDVKSIVECMHAFPRSKKDNGKSYAVNFNGQSIKLDMRHLGDGYYDEKWQEVMLKNRVWNSFGFYTMDQENYYYSLVYHGLLQKKVFAGDYREKLKKMAAELGIDASSPGEHIQNLNLFMRTNGYKYTDPTDPTVYINFSGLPKDLVRKNYYWRLMRIHRNTKRRCISLIKHLIRL
ncbi:hypothetical protein FACS1894147_05800 [Spirochaetia bacterium]|nr:hypothetical protein FACS1894147_05800 [Spirochaetia bacterium]